MYTFGVVLISLMLNDFCKAVGPTSSRMFEAFQNIDVTDWVASNPVVIPYLK